MLLGLPLTQHDMCLQLLKGYGCQFQFTRTLPIADFVSDRGRQKGAPFSSSWTVQRR